MSGDGNGSHWLHPDLQCITTSGLEPKSSAKPVHQMIRRLRLREESAYLTSSKADEISAGLDKSIFRVAGGLARVKPVPTTWNPASLKACDT